MNYTSEAISLCYNLLTVDNMVGQKVSHPPNYQKA